MVSDFFKSSLIVRIRGIFDNDGCRASPAEKW